MRYSIEVDGTKGEARYPGMSEAMDAVDRDALGRGARTVIHDEERRGHHVAFLVKPCSYMAGIEAEGVDLPG